MKPIMLLVFLAIMALLVSVLSAQNEQSEALSESEAIEVLRIVNTAQLDLKMTKGRYGGLEELTSHRAFAGRLLRPTLVGSDRATMKNYEVFLFLLPEGERYNVSLLPAQGGCQAAFFTGDSGVIYKGLALGCEPAK